MKIGYYSDTYPYVRNIIGKVRGGVEYQYLNLKDDKEREMAWLLYRIFNKFGINCTIKKSLETRLMAEIKSRSFYNVDLIHSFNAIIDNSCPYIITFETAVPRCVELLDYQKEEHSVEYSRTVLRYIRKLDSVNCKKLIAMSECAKRICECEIFDSGIDMDCVKRICDKITVLHPPQEELVTDIEITQKYKAMGDKIRFIFIGRDFFRKGGKEIIDTLKKYSDRCELTIISSLAYDDYSTHATAKEKDEVERYIRSQNWIHHYTECENKTVLELCKSAHVGLLPTFADTYGYSVLEMQACGLPVVTTNIRALPEINNEECGWIARLKMNEFGEALYSSDHSRKEMRDELHRELETVFEYIFSHTSEIETKAHKSLNRIRENHSPLKYSEKLERIYKQALE